MPYWSVKEPPEDVPTLDDVDLTDLGRFSAGFPRDAKLGGETIRAGDKVTLWWASANRDEAVFAGANLARLEMRLVFEALLDRFEEAALDGPIEWTRSNKHTGVRHMPVVLRRSAAARTAGAGGRA